MSSNDKDIRPVFITYPATYSLLMFNYLVCKANIKFSGVVLSSAHIKMKNRTLTLAASVIHLIKNCGLVYALYLLFACRCVYLIVGIWKITAILGGKKLDIKTFEKISSEYDIPLFRTTNINSDDTIEFINSVKANMIVSGYNNQILRYKTCKKLFYTGINIHNSYLPDFGGLDAAFENLYQKVKEAGATIHYIDKGIDTGQIIMQKKLPVYYDDTVFSLNIRQWVIGAQILPEVLELFKNNEVIVKKQDFKEARYPYRSFPGKARVGEFLRHGRHFILLREVIFPSKFVYELFSKKKF